MPSFTSAILPPQETRSLWGITERYLNVSSERYQSTLVGGNEYTITRLATVDAKQPLYLIALKVASYFTIVLPLLALGIRSFCRHRRMFVPLSSQDPSHRPLHHHVPVSGQPQPPLAFGNSVLSEHREDLDILVDTFNQAQKKTTKALPTIADYINPGKVQTMMNLYHAVLSLQMSLGDPHAPGVRPTDPEVQKLDTHLAGLCARFYNELIAAERSHGKGTP